jgi:D-alanyl-D-alanine carboxypeptidase
MKPAQSPDLRLLIERLDRRAKQRQATRAIVAGTMVLGFLALSSPFLVTQPQKTVATSPTTGSASTTTAYETVHLQAKAAIVYDLTTKEIIFAKNPKTQLPLASLTKLITTYAGASTLAPDAPITISVSALSEEGESGLHAGDTFSFTDVAKLALVASSNDAAQAIAEAASAHESTTGKRLLASAIASIGLPQTYAINGTGLDENSTLSGGYGSAYDIAQLAGALLAKAPALAEATTKASVSVHDAQGATHTLANTNQDAVHVASLLLSKTGYTDLAGGNLAIVYDAGIGHPVAVVVLGSTREGRFSDVSELVSLTGLRFAGIPPTHQ